MVGRGLHAIGTAPILIYSSPALRCLQTAANVIEILSKTEKTQPLIRIEPGLFEWMAWYDTPPSWMDINELKQFPIDKKYKEQITLDEMRFAHRRESSAHYMKRTAVVLSNISEVRQKLIAIIN